MARRIAIGMALVALLLPGRGAAEAALGARLGYALGLGDVGGTLGMNDWVSGQLPLQLDLTWRVRPNVALGVYFAWGLGRAGGDLASACDEPGAGCFASVRRLGVQVLRSFGAIRGFTPWVGGGAGYEWSTLSASPSSGRVHATIRGWEYLNLQVGADYPAARRLSVGPYLLVSIAEYGEGELGGEGGDIRDRSLHAWLGLGVRGTFEL